MTRSGLVAGALLVAALGGASWWLIGSRGDVVPEDAGETLEADAQPEKAGAALAARARGPGVAPVSEAVFAGRIVGRVVDEGGKPVGLVRVIARFDPVHGRGETVSVDQRGLADAERARSTIARIDAPAPGDEPSSVETTADAGGRFSLVASSAGSWVVDARPAPPLLGGRGWAWLRKEFPEASVVLRVVTGAAFLGRVVDGADKPVSATVSGAWTLAHRAASMGSTAAVATDPATGDFALALPEGRVVLTVRVAGRIELNVKAKAPRPDRLVIHLPSAGVVRGRVTDATGSALEEVDLAIAIAPRDIPSEGVFGGTVRAKTASDGTYRVEGAPTGRVSTVTIAAPGFPARVEQSGWARWTGLEVREGVDTVLDLIVGRGGVVTGRALEVGTGAAVPDVTVSLLPGQDRWPSETIRATTDATGRFRFDDVPIGRYVLLPTAPRHYFAPVAARVPDAPDPRGPVAPDAPVVAVAREGETVERDLALTPGLEVSGRVVGADGAPVGGAEVKTDASSAGGQVQWSWRVRWTGMQTAAATTAADGSFRVSNLAPTDTLYLYASKSPLLSDAAGPLSVAVGQTVAPVTLTLAVGASVAGRVVDGEGRPIPSQSISWNANDAKRQLYGQTTSADDGTFRIEGLPPGPLFLNAWATDEGSVQQTLAPPLKAGEAREGVELRFAKMSWLRGVVVDDQGKPVPNHSILVQGPSSREDRSQDDGSFDLAVTEGNYRIGSKQRGGNWGFEGSPESAKAPADGIRIVATAQSKTPTTLIGGKVVGPDGAPVSLCTLRAGPSAGGWNQQRSDEVVGGEFRREVEQGTPFDLVVSAPRGSRGEPLNLKGRTVRVESETTDLVIALEAGAEVFGRILDSSGAGVAGVVVRTEAVATVSDATGAFRLGGFGEAAVTLTVRAPTRYAPVPSLAATPGGDEVVVRLAPSGFVAGRVVGLEGFPGAQASVSVVGTMRSATVAEDGTFRVDGLATEGTVTLTVSTWSSRGDGVNSSLAPTKVDGVRIGATDVVLHLVRGVTIRGVVVTAEGKPPSEIWMHATGPSATGSHAPVDAEGKFEFVGLSPGPHSVVVQSQQTGAELAKVNVDAPADGVRVVLARVRKVTGRVTGLPEGRKVHLRLVTTATDTTAQSYAQAGSDGRFSIETTSAGPFSLRAYAIDLYAIAENVAPDTSVDLVLRPGLEIRGTVEVAQGSDFAGVRVTARSDRWESAGGVDASGQFVVRGLPPGRYALEARRQGSGTEASALEAVDAGATGVRLKLASAR